MQPASQPNEHLRHARLQHKWSQQEVADQVGTTIANISRWERGRTAPGPYFRQRLCDVFSASLAQLGLCAALGVAVSASPEVVWHVPLYRNPYFIGRDALLQQVAAHWQRPNKKPPIALCGLGGMGKTQVANEFAHRNRQRYRHVLWIHAETQETILADYLAIAQMAQLPMPPACQPAQTIRHVHQWLDHEPQWLLVIDNLEDVALWSQAAPTAGVGHILITTRLHTLGTLACCIPLEPLTLEDSLLLLRHRARGLTSDVPLEWTRVDDRQAASALCDILQGLPLALDQVGAYLEETGSSLARYLQLYQHHQALFLARRGAVLNDHPASVYATLTMTLDALQQTQPEAAALLQALAFLDPDAISLSMLQAGAEHLGLEVQAVIACPLLLDAALAKLQSLSLVKRRDDSVSLHRLVQVVVKAHLDTPTFRWWAERMVRVMIAAFPDSKEPLAWPMCQYYLPHALRMIALISTEQITVPAAQQLLARVGRYLYQLGRYAPAQALLHQRMQLLTEKDAPLEVAETLDTLASIAREQQRYAEAEALATKALALRRAIWGPVHPEIAESLNDLALVYRLLQRTDEAEEYYHQALSICRQTLGEIHWKTATLYNNLGLIANDRQDYAAAEPLYQLAFKIYGETIGEQSPYCAITLHNLANIYRHQGRLLEAEQTFLQAIALYQQTVGDTHPYEANTRQRLAAVYAKQERYSEAEHCLQVALRITRQVFGPCDLATAQVTLALGDLAHAQQHVPEAIDWYQQMLDLRAASPMPDHPDFVRCSAALDLLKQHIPTVLQNLPR